VVDLKVLVRLMYLSFFLSRLLPIQNHRDIRRFLGFLCAFNLSPLIFCILQIDAAFTVYRAYTQIITVKSVYYLAHNLPKPGSATLMGQHDLIPFLNWIDAEPAKSVNVE